MGTRSSGPKPVFDTELRERVVRDYRLYQNNKPLVLVERYGISETTLYRYVEESLWPNPKWRLK